MGKGFFTTIADWINGTGSKDKTGTDNIEPKTETRTAEKTSKSDKNRPKSAGRTTKKETSNKSEGKSVKRTTTKSDTRKSAAKSTARTTKKESAPSKKVEPISNNAIEKIDSLRDAVISTLKSNYAGTRISLNEYHLTVWIGDKIFFNSLTLNKFNESLITTITDELGLEFGSIEISNGQSPDSEATELISGCYLQLRSSVQEEPEVETPTPASISKAVISSVSGYGSIIGDSVCIDSEEIKTLPAQRYNIGAGKQPKMPDDSHRDNHIVIDDDPSSAEFSNNRFVSRAHAHISYSDKYGFVLYVERGGSRAAQKRTHIYRGGDKIELNNEFVPEVLKDGDYIVLSKHVHLLFKQSEI